MNISDTAPSHARLMSGADCREPLRPLTTTRKGG